MIVAITDGRANISLKRSNGPEIASSADAPKPSTKELKFRAGHDDLLPQPSLDIHRIELCSYSTFGKMRDIVSRAFMMQSDIEFYRVDRYGGMRQLLWDDDDELLHERGVADFSTISVRRIRGRDSLGILVHRPYDTAVTRHDVRYDDVIGVRLRAILGPGYENHVFYQQVTIDNNAAIEGAPAHLITRKQVVDESETFEESDFRDGILVFVSFPT